MWLAYALTPPRYISRLFPFFDMTFRAPQLFHSDCSTSFLKETERGGRNDNHENGAHDHAFLRST